MSTHIRLPLKIVESVLDRPVRLTPLSFIHLDEALTAPLSQKSLDLGTATEATTYL